jgi:osmotically-inducible protein OsmY
MDYHRISEELTAELAANSVVRNFQIKACIYDNNLILTGTVRNFFQKQIAITVAKKYQEKFSLQIIPKIMVG